jgi:hypothetical protein
VPKVSKYPRLRTKVYKGRTGQVYVYYVYDMRPEGKPDIRLGDDRIEALRQWDELHHHKPRTVGRLLEAFERWRDRELPTYANVETRRSYSKQLTKLEKVFGEMLWEDITLPLLREYLDRRVSMVKGETRLATTQGNREMSLLSVVWGRAILWGMTRLPWPAAGVKNWKNEEGARQFEVTDVLFDCVYAEADQVLRDCMDIATATGMRLTDARTVRMPTGGVLSFRSNKKDKPATFDVAESPVLSALVERREAMKAYCVMLLTTPTGRQVTARMLSDRYDAARDRAADKAAKTGNTELAQSIRAMYLRDMRKRAADLSGSTDAASKLLQHSDPRITQKHYRTQGEKLKAVR